MKDQFTSTSAGRLHWRESGSGEPLILLHSNGYSGHQYDDAVPLLDKRFRVIALDFPGQGDSEPLTRHFSVEQYTDAVMGFMDAIGLEKAWIVGASIGGLVCADLAARHSARALGVVVVEAVLRSPSEWEEHWQSVEVTFGADVQPFEEVAPRFRQLTAKEHRRWNVDRAKCGVWTLMDVMWAIRDYDISKQGDQLRERSRMVSVIMGDFGPAIKSEAVWRRYLPHSELRVLEECGHFPMIDDPEAFARAVESLVASMRSARGSAADHGR